MGIKLTTNNKICYFSYYNWYSQRLILSDHYFNYLQNSKESKLQSFFDNFKNDSLFNENKSYYTKLNKYRYYFNLYSNDLQKLNILGIIILMHLIRMAVILLIIQKKY